MTAKWYCPVSEDHECRRSDCVGARCSLATPAVSLPPAPIEDTQLLDRLHTERLDILARMVQQLRAENTRLTEDRTAAWANNATLKAENDRLLALIEVYKAFRDTAGAELERMRAAIGNLIEAADDGEWHSSVDCAIEGSGQDCDLCQAIRDAALTAGAGDSQ